MKKFILKEFLTHNFSIYQRQKQTVLVKWVCLFVFTKINLG